ncbi:transporter [Arthrobacter echini]|uniref:Transporter n=1 Tax=Arthrobacter echini TaxID=1529066 RepID=A0A4S5E9P1_9MICC|nr:transporter [Arthrobacter echini]THJ68354.1 transporter [Arthrobacter echini]
MSSMVVLGLIASVALLAGFALLNLGKLTPDHYTYQLLNFIGAGFLTASAADPFNAGVFWTELIWSLLGLFGIIKIWTKRRKQTAPESSTPLVASRPEGEK